MNIKEYIESGILEAYILGSLTPEQMAEVEANISNYPEIAAEYEAIEDTMLSFAEEQAVTPPASMQAQIWDALQEDSKSEPASQPASNIPLPPAERGGSGNVSWQKAAVWAAVLVSVITNFVLLSQRNASNEQKDILATKVDSLQTVQEQLGNTIAAYKQEKDILANPETQTVIMRKEGDNDVTGWVYWNKQKGEAYLALHNMPLPPAGKQYQLWVIQDGKPVDMGLIDNNTITNTGAIHKIAKAVRSGQAFAISLENEGGNPTPTQVYMVGATS